MSRQEWIHLGELLGVCVGFIFSAAFAIRFLGVLIVRMLLRRLGL